MNKNTTTSTENLYHLNGKISVKQAIPFGLQHILAMFVANIAPIFIVAAASRGGRRSTPGWPPQPAGCPQLTAPL